MYDICTEACTHLLYLSPTDMYKSNHELTIFIKVKCNQITVYKNLSKVHSLS